MNSALLVLTLLLSAVNGNKKVDVDPQGYILYCPCMGEFAPLSL